MAKLDTSTDPQVGFRPPGDLDAATALARYDGPFGRRQAAHLLRRAGFGGTADQIDALASLGASGAVDSLLHPRGAEPEFPDFPDTEALYDPKRRNAAAQLWWIDRMLRTNRPLNEKMTLFWHGHFATSIRKVEPRLMVAQINLLRSQALGNFRSLLLSISRDPAMLIWLDNRYNAKAHPNENYARELMELFSLGLGNYTEDDIKESARAFTGWSIDKQTAFVFNPNQHDNGTKTFLGRSGDFDGTDIVNIIVSQPIHQRFISRKLLQFFVYSDPEPELIEATASVYAMSGYDIGKTVATILRSNVFYSPRAYRALPKSPIEFGVGLLRYLGYASVPADTPYWFGRMGQEPLAPPSVKGWDGGPAWISTATLLARFNYVSRVVNAQPPKAPAAAAAMTAPPVAAAYPSLSPDSIVARAGGMDASKILEWIVTGSIQDDLTGDSRSGLLTYLSSGDAANPTPLGGENYQQKIRGTLALVLNLPSNQLN